MFDGDRGLVGDGFHQALVIWPEGLRHWPHQHQRASTAELGISAVVACCTTQPTTPSPTLKLVSSARDTGTPMAALTLSSRPPSSSKKTVAASKAMVALRRSSVSRSVWSRSSEVLSAALIWVRSRKEGSGLTLPPGSRRSRELRGRRPEDDTPRGWSVTVGV
jgi:hypothetical protein